MLENEKERKITLAHQRGELEKLFTKEYLQRFFSGFTPFVWLSKSGISIQV